MKRSASLDFLRGSAAFAVAIPHYLTTDAPFQPLTEAVAISGVEVFFVLSGFVLAPQIVDWVVGRPWRNLGVFLARRWMRTIPPYLVALAAAALMTGSFFSADSLRYAFYVENLYQAANAADFYPVAWSLAVEEWFYLLFAPLLFVVGRALGRSDRKLDVVFAVLVIAGVAAIRLRFGSPDWDLNIRRVTIFRIDSIVWGYLLFLALERRMPFRARVNCDATLLARLAALGLAALALTALELFIAAIAVKGGIGAQRAFPYSSALFGMSWVWFFREAEPVFRPSWLRSFSFTIGRISYSAYLFHIILVMALKPRIATWPLPAQLALYLAILFAFGLVFWRGFERPILAARPNYSPDGAVAASPRRRGEGRADEVDGSERPPILDFPRSGGGDATRREARTKIPAPATLALWLAAIVAGVVARNAFMANEPAFFYPALIGTALALLSLADKAGRFANGCGAAAQTFLLFALALPAADSFYRASTGTPLKASTAAPTYSYRAAHENPAAFAMWWFYYLNEWIRRDGVRAAIEAPDPQKKLPFVLVPGSSGRMFDTTIRINQAGFRGPELAADKNGKFRIFALGESQTFGPTLRDGERPWPEQLQGLFDHAACSRAVEIVNAGTEAYTLKDNIERLRRDILPLKPDLILSTHGMNGLLALGLRLQPEPKEPGPRPRGSALLGRAMLTLERAAYDLRAGAAPLSAPPPMSDEALLKSRYADAYRGLIALARDNHVAVAIATSTMAVDANSPREVKDFYGSVFKPIDDILAANAAHNRLVRLIGGEEGVPVLDIRQGLDGVWDDDLYLDIVHFTEAGHETMARNMFGALLPVLAKDGVRCSRPL